MRITAVLTNTPAGIVPGQAAGLELRHRQHARVEDRIREAEATGLRNLPPSVQREPGLARGRPDRRGPGLLDQDLPRRRDRTGPMRDCRVPLPSPARRRPNNPRPDSGHDSGLSGGAGADLHRCVRRHATNEHSTDRLVCTCLSGLLRCTPEGGWAVGDDLVVGAGVVLAAQAEDGLEGGHRCATSVEPEDVLVEVDLKVLAGHAAVGAL